MRHRWLILAIAWLGVTFLFSCEKEEVGPNEGDNQDNSLNESFYELMNTWYYWYDQIPDIDPGNYDDPDAVLEAVRYEEDRWSYITSYEAFLQYYQEGAYIGYGFGHRWDATDSLRITFVFDDSPLKGAGIERGWSITEVNNDPIDPSENLSDRLGRNEVGERNYFRFRSPHGEVVDTSLVKEEITMNTVLMDTVINQGTQKVGYFVLKSFINKTPDELAETFEKFDQQNIDELAIDLRYNGGGTLSASRFLADFVINEGNVGDAYVKITHNDKQSDNDTTHVFQQDTLGVSLGLDRVYFITTQATASASEALINGLKPFMEVYQVGQTTYGKPVGMYAFTDNSQQYAFVPVCFSLMNANNNADYFDGLPVDVEAADGLRHPFGTGEEDMFHQVLYHIQNGSFDMTKAGYPVIPANRVEYNSLEDEIGAL
jgi:C-terminal processing protease CtpA/Prc